MNQKRRSGTLRIIGGTWRGRKIRFSGAQGLRPTLDRVRETLFNWLAADIAGAHCLDLYAGTGALSFEALSRGAASAVAVERSARVLRDLHRNRSTLAASRLSVVRAEALPYLAATHRRTFDVIFVDPPFHRGLVPASLAALVRSDCLTESSLIYVEHEADCDFVQEEHWVRTRDRHAGATRFMLLKRAS